MYYQEKSQNEGEEKYNAIVKPVHKTSQNKMGQGWEWITLHCFGIRLSQRTTRMTKWRHYQCIPWDPCDQYYQLTDRWGLVPASQLPGVSIIIRVRDTRDQWPPWCEEMVISGYKHCLSQSPLIFPSPPPLYWYLISIFRSQCNQTATVWLLVWAPTLSPTLICLPSRLGAGQGEWLPPPRPRPRLTSSAGPCPRIIMRNRQILGSTKVFKCSKIFKWILSERTFKWIVTRV